MRAGGCGLPALTPRGRAGISSRGFRCDHPGSSLQSCLKLLPKSTWIQRQQCCLLFWRSCFSPLGLFWGRPKASSPQVSGPDNCLWPWAREGKSGYSPGRGARIWGKLSRPEGEGQGQGRERCPQSLCQVGRGAPVWASRGAGNFCLRDPLFLYEVRSGRRLARLCGSV